MNTIFNTTRGTPFIGTINEFLKSNAQFQSLSCALQLILTGWHPYYMFSYENLQLWELVKNIPALIYNELQHIVVTYSVKIDFNLHHIRSHL